MLAYPLAEHLQASLSVYIFLSVGRLQEENMVEGRSHIFALPE